MTNDDITKEAVRYMLERGLAHPIELERLSGRSKQIIRIWAQEYPDARDEFLKKKWAKALLSVGKKYQRIADSAVPIISARRRSCLPNQPDFLFPRHCVD